MRTSAWSPFRYQIFRALWLAQFVSNVGTWMQSVGAAWLMIQLHGSAALVALVQTASSLPIVFVGIAAGVLADQVDRRRLLIFTQLVMLIAASALAAIAGFGHATPVALLWLTFALGIGAALNGPAWQAIQPELVPREEFQQAVTLGGAGINLGRAIGPAIGGLIIAFSGPWLVFLLNAVSFAGVVVVLWEWRRQSEEPVGPRERFFGAVRAGLRYVLFSQQLFGVFVRAAAFSLASAGFLALLPVYSTSILGFGSTGLGVLFGCFGAGAVLAAWSLPRFREWWGNNGVVTVGTVLMVLPLGVMAFFHQQATAFFMAFIGGIAWLLCLSTFNYSTQAALPGWVRARGLALYLTIVQGGLAVGAAAWGRLANAVGVTSTFAWGALAVGITLGFSLRWRIPATGAQDLSPSPLAAADARLSPEDTGGGPVLVLVGYDVRPDAEEGFLAALAALGRARRRTGAARWSAYRQAEEPHRFMETFELASWEEHLRQHGRRTVEDAEAQRRLRQFLVPGAEPTVEHYLAPLRSAVRWRIR
jgi:MFS family permease